MTLRIDAVNAMDREAFVAAVGSTFECAPWIAEQAWSSRPFADAIALHQALFEVVLRASPSERIAFLCGHPDLAGKEASAGSMTPESVGEQASAGLDALSQDQLVVMQRTNRAYRERHGFPFIIAVRRHTRAEIFDAMHRRLGEDTSRELEEALRQIFLITQGRVEALFNAPGDAI